MNYSIILTTLGWVLNFEALSMLLPIICSVIYKEKCTPFIISLLICLIFGILLTIKKPKEKTMYAREGFIIVALSWIVMSLFGTLPFIISGSIPSFTDAFFETVSGFTTTGASILNDIESLPKGILFWRSFTHWIGGMGVLVFLVAILPLSGGSNLYLMKAESPGPSVSKLVPRIKTTALILYGIYTFLTLAEFIFLLFSGIGVYESITIAISTAGTGGFAVKNSSLALYSPYVQNVVTVFMLLFGVNFSIYYLFLIKRFKEALKSAELKVYIGIVLTSIILIFINVHNMFDTIGEALRHSAFTVGAIITTTGFMSYDFDLWPTFSKTIIVLLMFVGACAGSTGGGIKVSRIYILLKTAIEELKIVINPHRVHKVMMDSRTVEHKTLRSINVYFVSYMFVLAISLLLISVDNFDFTTNFTSVVTALNNIGPGLNITGPTKNFSVFSDFSKFVLCFDMLVGRLEVFPILILFSPHTWKK